MAGGCKGNRKDILQTILGVFIPPLRMWLNRDKCDAPQLITMVFMFPFVLLFPMSIILSFHYTDNMDVAQNICCLLLPPLGVYLGQKKCGWDVLIALILCFLLWFPGVCFAYWRS